MIFKSIFGKRSPKRSQFLMPVDDVFALSTSGKVVVVGVIKAGAIRPGDSLFLQSLKYSIPVLVESLEANHELLKRAKAGDRIGVLLSGVNEEMVIRSKPVDLHLASFNLMPKGPEGNDSDFKLAAGVSVADLSGVSEGFSLQETDQGYSVLIVNVSADRLKNTFLSLASLVRTPGFAIVEIPTPQQVEEQLRKEDTDPFHWDVYHLDGIEYGRFKALFLENSEFFVEEGFITFGFASQRGFDEVFVGRYKVTYIYSDEPEKYKETLESLGYERREPLKTVINNITPQMPGRTATAPIDGKTIYDLIQELKDGEGFCFAERKEED